MIPRPGHLVKAPGLKYQLFGDVFEHYRCVCVIIERSCDPGRAFGQLANDAAPICGAHRARHLGIGERIVDLIDRKPRDRMSEASEIGIGEHAFIIAYRGAPVNVTVR